MNGGRIGVLRPRARTRRGRRSALTPTLTAAPTLHQPGAYRTEELKPYVLPVVTKAEEMMMAAAENKEYLPVQVGVLRSARPRYLLAYPVSNGALRPRGARAAPPIHRGGGGVYMRRGARPSQGGERPRGAASAIASFWQPPAVCVCPVVLSTC